MQTLKIGDSFWNLIIENNKIVFLDGPYTTSENAKASQKLSEF